MSDVLAALQETLEARKSDGAENSYVASLYSQGLNKILEKVGEEATETVLAAKDYDGTDAARSAVIAETADLWFHSLVMLAHFGSSVRRSSRYTGQSHWHLGH
jgi:phosphoribosyl-ATP pyrophosphohydrolase